MHKLQLSSDWNRCPTQWRNFADYIINAESIPDGAGIPDCILANYLSLYRAKWERNDWEDPIIEFEAAEDATAFILKYS